LDVLEEIFTNGTSPSSDWLRAILMESPAYLRAKGATGSKNNEARLRSLLDKVLGAKTPAERARLVLSIIPELNDISLLCAFVRSVQGDWSETAADGDAPAPYFGISTADLRTSLLDRVVALAEAGGLWSQASPAALLWFWFACDQEQKVYVFTKKSMADANSLANLMEIGIERIQVNGADHDVIPVRRWSKIVDFHTLETRALEVAMAGASREIRSRARRFLDAYANGKSDLFR
jgi:hypothetical protein